MDENVNENNNEKEEGTVPSDEVVIQQATSEAQSAVVTITSSGLRGH